MQAHKWKRMLGCGLLMTVWLSAARGPTFAQQPRPEALRSGRGMVMPLAYQQDGRWQQEPSAVAVVSDASSPAAGVREVDVPAPFPGASANFAGLLWRLVLGTGLSVCACLAVLWLARRGGFPIGPRAAMHENMQLLETLCLPNRCCLHLVRVNDRWLMVGCDASGLKHVGALPEAFAMQLASEESRVAGGEPRAATGAFGDRVTIDS